MASEKLNKEVLSEKVELRDRPESEKMTESIVPLSHSLDALENVGGFQLIKGLVKDIDKLDPKKKASRKVFLEEDDFAGMRKRMRDELGVLISILDSDSKDSLEITKDLKTKREKLEKLLGENLGTIHEELRSLEITYRSLSSFFANAGQGKIDCITLMNVDKKELKNFDSLDTSQVRKEISKDYDQLDLKKSYSLFVLPGYLGNSNNVREWAETAYNNKVMMITDFRDCESFEDLYALLDEANLQGSETKMGNVIMTCNYILGRKKSERAMEENNLYLPGSAALAGRMSKVKEIMISQGVAGMKYGTLSNVMGTRLDLLKSEIEALIKSGVVPMVEMDGRTMAFSNKTLYNGATLGLQEYSIVRVFDWIGKVIQDFVNKKAFENWDSNVSSEIKSAVIDFLDRHKGAGHLIEKYSVDKIEQKEDKTIDIKVTLKPFFAAKSFLIELSGKDTGVSGSRDWDMKVNKVD